jgi:VanZ family protein
VPTPEGAPGALAPLVHVVLFAVLGAVLRRTWTRRGWPRPAVGPVLAAVGYGAVTELVQAGLTHRTGDPLDVVADAVGALLGVASAAGLGRVGAHAISRRAGS